MLRQPIPNQTSACPGLLLLREYPGHQQGRYDRDGPRHTEIGALRETAVATATNAIKIIHPLIVESAPRARSPVVGAHRKPGSRAPRPPRWRCAQYQHSGEG